MGEVKRDWQDSGTILSYFSPKQKRAVLLYEQFVAEGIALGNRPELVGGGLIRSLPGYGLEGMASSHCNGAFGHAIFASPQTKTCSQGSNAHLKRFGRDFEDRHAKKEAFL